MMCPWILGASKSHGFMPITMFWFATKITYFIMQIGWVNSWFEQCGVDLWWCYSKLLNFNAPPWNTYTLCVEETCANACRNKHAMLCCTASDIWPFKHFFDVDLVCVMQFSLLELVDVVKLFDFIVWFSNECVSPNKIEDYLVSSKVSCFVM